MRVVIVLLCLLLSEPGAAYRRTTVGGDTAAHTFWDSASGQKLRQSAYAAARERQYHLAAGVYRQGYEAAVLRRDDYAAGRFLNNIASCQFATFDFRAAMASYIDARRLALRAGDTDTAATVALNVASLYVHTGALDAASQVAEDSLPVPGATKDKRYLAATLQLLGWVQARKGQIEAARANIARSAEVAAQAGDFSFQAKSWDKLGYALLQKDMLEDATPVLLEAHRLRRMLCPAEAYLSYLNLAELHRRMGEPQRGAVWADLALRAATQGLAEIPVWAAHYQRGRIRLSLGRYRDALDDFRSALEFARRWRLDAVPSQPARLGMEVTMHELFAGLISSAHSLYRQKHDASLVKESFAAAVDSQAWSLRTILIERSREAKRLPEAYYRDLAELRLESARALSRGEEAQSKRAAHLSQRMTELESAAGMEAQAIPLRVASGVVGDLRRRLGAGEALVVFSLNDPESTVWLLTAKDLLMTALPSRKEVAAAVGRFREALEGGHDAADREGRALYTMLFGSLDSRVRNVRRLRIVPDRELFGLPFAALIPSEENVPVSYLVERTAIQIAPSAALAFANAAPDVGGGLLALGDPIYNRSDSRYRASRKLSWDRMLNPDPSTGREPPLDLPRLPGSAREIAACGRLWGPLQSSLRTGPAASLQGLLDGIGRNPSVIHLATHVLPSKVLPDEVMIALSMHQDGYAQVLTQGDITSLRLHGGVVAMSACSSGAGRVLPSAGLLGLTRAWLLAGARTVVASFWPTSDDGQLFVQFYSHLLRREPGSAAASVAGALRDAQLDCIRSGSWRAEPRYWAAYFAYGKD
jgi:CHAT domain-containing protein